MTLDDKINEIALLPTNWNGNGAVRFSADVIDRARCVAKVLDGCGFDCFPTGNDSIQFEKTTCGQYLELEVFADRVESYNETESRSANS